MSRTALLIPIGLHQFLNTFFWFQSASSPSRTAAIVHGDINRFLAGDPTAGQFTSGFFPIMMFALPAAALAIAHCARPERRKEVGRADAVGGLTSFVTGMTEPMEFSFLFVAPLLYGMHAVLTGVSMAVTWALGVHAVQLLGRADRLRRQLASGTKPWLIIPIGLCFAVVYYVIFRFAITKFDLQTPGREPEEEGGAGPEEDAHEVEGLAARASAQALGPAGPGAFVVSPQGGGGTTGGRNSQVPYLTLTVLQQVYTTEWCRPRGRSRRRVPRVAASP